MDLRGRVMRRVRLSIDTSEKAAGIRSWKRIVYERLRQKSFQLGADLICAQTGSSDFGTASTLASFGEG